MVEDWEADLDDSREAFIDLVAPKVEEWIGGEVINIESVTESSVADKLDTLAGVDVWDIQEGDGVRGLASRVQFGTAWDSFTIRKARSSQIGTDYETEFEKRRRQINNDYVYPHHTVQAYVDKSNWRLKSAAKVNTKALIKFVENGEEGEKETWYGKGYGEGDYWTNRVNNPDGSWEEFYCVDWDYLRDQGKGVRISRPHEDPDEVVAPRSQSPLDAFLSGGSG